MDLQATAGFLKHSSMVVSVLIAAALTCRAQSGFLDRPAGIARDSGGTLYIADEANNRVVKVAPGGGLSSLASNLS